MQASILRKSLGIFSLILFLVLGARFSVRAQNPGISWQIPTNISNTTTSSIFPAIVTDKFGTVHVFWGEDINGKIVDPPELENRSNSIVYSYGDGASWSTPVDIFSSTSGSAYNYPYATIDSKGILHIVWQSYQGIYYSSVPVSSAKWVKAWGPAKLIASVRGDGPRIYASSKWGLQVIYPALENVEGGSHDGNIYYIQSQDNGQTWSTSVKLSSLSGNENATSSHPSLVDDGQGNLHALWFMSEAPDWRGSIVYYSRSEDGGIGWSNPEIIGQRTGDERWASMPEITISNETEVHITWVCGVNAYRCHRWSKDGGINWSNTNRLFGDMLSLAGWDTLVIDGNGQLYWIMQLRYPVALYYSFWTGRQWSGLQLLNDGILAGGHYLRAVVHNGNQLDLVMVQQDEKEIWYIKGITDADPIEPESQSAMDTASDINNIATVESIENQNQVYTKITETSPLFITSGEIIDPNNNSTGMVLAISILPVIGLIIVIILIRSVISRQ